MAEQLVLHFNQLGIFDPDWVAGIPDGATGLGKEIASCLNAKIACMEKIDGKIVLTSTIPFNDSLLLAEDLCTRGTGFCETVLNILMQNSHIRILPYELVLINRGGLEMIDVPGLEPFKIVALAEHRITDWEKDDCCLCNDFGSVSIKPKVSDANWEDIMSSQNTIVQK